MTTLRMIGGTFGWYTVGLLSVILMIGSLAALIETFWARQSARARLRVTLCALLAFAVMIVLLDNAVLLGKPHLKADFMSFQIWLFELPWLLYAAMELLVACLLLLCLRSNRRFRCAHLTVDSIRETVNLLPEGIAVSTQDGTVLLANLKMHDLCRALTGSALSDTGRFWKDASASGEVQGESILCRVPEGSVWLLSKKQLTVDGQTYDQITAAEVTERYRIIEDLEEKNEHLQDLQRRMKAVSDLSGDMFVAQEEMAARSALHNQLGQVLLMGRRYLEHPEETDARLVYMTTRQMNAFLLGDAERPDRDEENEIRHTLALARSIGVRVDVRGPAPKGETARRIFAHMIQECAANTAKHAEGDTMTVTVTEEGGETCFRVSNNGKPPKGNVQESGGLLSLRHSVEAAGGRMEVQSQPTFQLTIYLPSAQ